MSRIAQLHVLVADDMRAMRQLVRSSLLQLGFKHIAEAEDGAAGFARAKMLEPDLIISDLNMPHMDGLGFLKSVRQSLALRDTAFIMLTSRGDGELVRQAIELRVNNYLMKPFTMDALKRKIEAVLGPLA